MNLKSSLNRVACGGILLSCAFLFHGSGVAAEANATRALSARQRHLAFNQSKSDENATVAPSQVDDDDDDDDERALALFESVSKASTNAMKGIKSNAMVQKMFSKDPKLARTKTTFDKLGLQLKDPDNFFKQANFQPWFEKTIQRYKSDEKKAYAAMYSTVLSRSKGDDEAVAKLINSPSNLYAFHWIDAQVNNWKARDLDTGKVFDLLKLKKEGPNLLNSPKLSSWVKFAEAKNEDSAEKLWEILRSQRDLARLGQHAEMPRHFEAYFFAELGKVLQTSRKTPDAEHLGSLLDTKLLARWKQQKYSIAKALQDMGIGPDDLKVWLAYIHTMGNKDPYTIFVTAGKFEDKAVAGAIGLALQSKISSMKSIGQNMQRRQNELWSKDGKKPETLFGDLKLQNAGDNLFASPLWPVWMSYLKFLDEKGANTRMMMTLRKYFKDDKLLGIITKAKQVSET